MDIEFTGLSIMVHGLELNLNFFKDTSVMYLMIQHKFLVNRLIVFMVHFPFFTVHLTKLTSRRGTWRRGPPPPCP